jgi:dienelactone hydrolase
MPIQQQNIDYQDSDTRCKGLLAFDEQRSGPLPGILISHAWGGRDEFVTQKARELARLGYAAFALDMYGNGKLGHSMEENSALMTPFVSDRALLSRRINAALTAMRALPQVDARRIGAMGYCFGGMCALDLARSGADVRGVVSVHGLLKSPGITRSQAIKAKVLVLHGHDDPMVPVADVVAFEQEMTEAKVDWQVHVYGGTKHAFTNPAATDPNTPMVYNDAADRRSGKALLEFFEEVLR